MKSRQSIGTIYLKADRSHCFAVDIYLVRTYDQIGFSSASHLTRTPVGADMVAKAPTKLSPGDLIGLFQGHFNGQGYSTYAKMIISNVGFQVHAAGR